MVAAVQRLEEGFEVGGQVQRHWPLRLGAVVQVDEQAAEEGRLLEQTSAGERGSGGVAARSGREPDLDLVQQGPVRADGFEESLKSYCGGGADGVVAVKDGGGLALQLLVHAQEACREAGLGVGCPVHLPGSSSWDWLRPSTAQRVVVRSSRDCHFMALVGVKLFVDHDANLRMQV